MKKEIEARLKILESDIEQFSYDRKLEEECQQRIDLLNQLYDALYGL